jgi:membrane complex biogenesis BtpA family protein
MTRIALAVRVAVPELCLGINVLRNDGAAAVAIAAAVDASFVRVNVLAGASWTDQGLIQGAAREVLLLRRRLQRDGAPAIRIAADICVKHGVPAGEQRRVHAARDTAGRGGADVLIVTGAATGAPADISDIPDIRSMGRVPVWVGSGVTHDTASSVARVADGAIVGTALHQDADITRPLCVDRVRAMVASFQVA